ncbi:hypothetical protein G5I_11492 [Acromyrmex echinatior]|uniref:Uncharacterized protein n=1 Tax=Acromyrmex echinatior TaxID=103372 RepID=F4WZN5_ACREC|nr:hypothetical protein G5I_11492 [Acromyrmex echinatior]
MVCTLSKWPPPMVSLVLRLAWSERQHGAHRVTQFPINTPPYIGFYAMGKHNIALPQHYVLDTSRESKSIHVKSTGLTGLLGKRATRCARLAHTLTESRTGNYGYVVQT